MRMKELRFGGKPSKTKGLERKEVRFAKKICKTSVR